VGLEGALICGNNEDIPHFPVGWSSRKETITVIRASRLEQSYHCRPSPIPAVIIAPLLLVALITVGLGKPEITVTQRLR